MTTKELMQGLLDGHILKNKFGGMLRLNERGMMEEYNFEDKCWGETTDFLCEDMNKWQIDKQLEMKI